MFYALCWLLSLGRQVLLIGTIERMDLMSSCLLFRFGGVVAGMMISASAMAGFIIEGGERDVTGPYNDVIGNVDGFYGATLMVEEDSEVVFTMVGYEAGWDNYLGTSATGEHIYNKGGAGQAFTVSAAVFNPVDFFFDVRPDTPWQMSVANGDNIAPCAMASCAPNFWLGWVDGIEGGDVWIALDDGGAGPDDNHDDLVVRARVVSVPEPGTISLLVLGLMGLLVARKRGE